MREMLDFSGSLPLDKSPTLLKELLEQVVAVAQEEAGRRGVDLKITHADGLKPVNVDPMRLEQALLNLVSNAVQASPGGAAVNLAGICSEREVVIEVSDSGEGIPEHIRSQIFTPFITTRKEGTGLGLAIVKKVVEAHAGRLEIVDNPYRGVTFRIILPQS